MKRRDPVKWIFSSKDNTELAERYDKWVLAELSELLQSLLKGEPGLLNQVWAYQVL